jgi:hypothetical protein
MDDPWLAQGLTQSERICPCVLQQRTLAALFRLFLLCRVVAPFLNIVEPKVVENFVVVEMVGVEFFKVKAKVAKVVADAKRNSVLDRVDKVKLGEDAKVADLVLIDELVVVELEVCNQTCGR